MPAVPLILVGGFLGAGKTTLLAQAARRLHAAGKRVGLVTNDQAANLVDTLQLADAGFAVEEVAGGCFCCRFADLVEAAHRLQVEAHPDVLFGEPVGSCTDLAATLLAPLTAYHAPRFHLAPYCVLVDPVRAVDSLPGAVSAAFPADVVYIYRKQLEEADAIVINKIDALSPADVERLHGRLNDAYPGRRVFAVSALRGDGVDAWLEFVLSGATAGRRIVDVDYDTYAAGEAALGWLNAAVQLRSAGAIDWPQYCLDLLRGVQRRLQEQRAEIAHVKLRLTAGQGSVLVNLTRNDAAPVLRGRIEGDPRQALLVFNARAHVAPERLRQALEESLAAGSVQVIVEDLKSFRPARPEPTHRMPASEP